MTSSFVDFPTSAFTTASWSSGWIPEDVIWIVVLGFVAAFLLSFSVGANDVANSFGTTVGAKVLTLRQACALATIFETAGAVLLGAKVGEMIRKGIIDVEVYQTVDGARLLMLGEVAAMLGSSIWQLIATLLKIPVSGTHSIVGACIGFSLVAAGSTGVNWHNLGFIVASWFISPALSGIMAVGLYVIIQKYIVTSKVPLRNGLRALPFFYAFSVGLNVFSILFSGAPLLGMDNPPGWGIALISLGIMIFTGIFIECYLVTKIEKIERKESLKTALEEKAEEKKSSPCNFVSLNEKTEEIIKVDIVTDANEVKKEFLSDLNNKNKTEFEKSVKFEQVDSDSTSYVFSEEDDLDERAFTVKLMTSDTSIDQCGSVDKKIKKKEIDRTKQYKWKNNNRRRKKVDDDDVVVNDDDPVIICRLFSSLQVLTACFASFAHGGNDVSNAIGPLIAIWIIFHTGEVSQKAFTPWYLLLYGGFGISIGLWLFGRRVMETIGKDLTKITPSRGFCIEIMTAFTVLIASNLGIPISTTHCKVGAVISIGWYRSRSAVAWSMARNIALAWFVTLPIAGLLSAGAMFLLMQI